MITRHDLTEELLTEAIRVVVRSQSASVTQLQRRCYVGYATACRILERLERLGVLSPQQGALPREVLVVEDALPQALPRLQLGEASR
ncbi:DNA translocase FtsK [Nonomuraea sp. MTCD27]|uniref:DNA translocase FtsK n=1 Tax=Nonomuraea sp. MTCD27 TaxID=1676747 RepID=UPI0035BEC8FA